MTTLAELAGARRGDLLNRCASFVSRAERTEGRAAYGMPIDGPLDAHVTVHGRDLVCFDSNGYLGLQRHPRVVAAVHRALDEVGYGTPSAQLLGGTTRHLRVLEDTVSAFVGREATLVFPSGYAANVGALTALLGPHDFVFHDRFVHASVVDGCRWSGARRRAYAHGDLARLDRLLASATAGAGVLVATDGLFSMHGTIADVAALRRICDARSARLLVDDAHGLGVLGANGRGVEEHGGAIGAADVLVGTFSKAVGAVGGFVSGSRALVEYLRFHARAGVFTASLPAATCAGIVEAFRVIVDEPERRARLWENVRRLWSGLADAGWRVPSTPGPIITVHIGDEPRLYRASAELLRRGIKVGVVASPAVPRGEAVLRLSASANHTADDLDRTLRAFAVMAREMAA